MRYQSVNPCRVSSSPSFSLSSSLSSCLVLSSPLPSSLFSVSVFLLCLSVSEWCCGRVVAVWRVGYTLKKNRVSTHNVPVRVYVSKRPVYAGTKRTCVNACARGAGYTRGRFESTHGDVLSGHTEKGGNHRQFCLPKFAHIRLSRASEVQRK